ncbi:MAG: hypothetical protein Q7S04_00865 [Candidatus Moranbacteria bacterium]|nr:hypothetical protein [Candidatus Moranbacteria bacterium]
MRNSPLKFVSIAVALAFSGYAYATPEALPAGAKVSCTANADGTGTLAISGVDVKRVELYVHAPTSKKSILDSAASYKVPANATFNFVFKNAAGEDRYVQVGGDNPARVARVFAASGTAASASTFDGVMAVPDARNGGIGNGGASLGCSHMLRRTTASAK